MRLVDVAVSVLVPFLAVYVSYGLFKEDLYRFTNEAAYAEFNQFSLEGPPDVDFVARLAIYDWQVVLAIVAIAWVLRFALAKIESVTRFLWPAFLGALVEVYYTSQVAQKVRRVPGGWRRLGRGATCLPARARAVRPRALHPGSARQPRRHRDGVALRSPRRRHRRHHRPARVAHGRCRRPRAQALPAGVARVLPAAARAVGAHSGPRAPLRWRPRRRCARALVGVLERTADDGDSRP